MIYRLSCNLNSLLYTNTQARHEPQGRSQERDATRCQDSEALIVFLTNSYLSRPFCLKELGWAIEFDKPILVVVEKKIDFGLGTWNVGARIDVHETRTTSGSRVVE